MTDQCKHCAFRGDLKSCLASVCHQHENWYAKKQQERIEEAANQAVLIANYALDDPNIQEMAERIVNLLMSPKT